MSSFSGHSQITFKVFCGVLDRWSSCGATRFMSEHFGGHRSDPAVGLTLLYLITVVGSYSPANTGNKNSDEETM